MVKKTEKKTYIYAKVKKIALKKRLIQAMDYILIQALLMA